MPSSRKSGAIRWSRSRRHNLKLFLKPSCWTLLQGRLGSCTTNRGRRFNGCLFRFGPGRIGRQPPCRPRPTLAPSRAESFRERPQAPFSAATAFSIASRSGSDATIFKSERRIPFRRLPLISKMTSPRTKLPNSGTKRPSWRTARIQYRRLGLIIIANRGRRAAFEGGDATGAQGFARHEPDGTVAALAVHKGALALDMIKERAFSWAVDVPEAEIILVDCSHLDRPPVGGRRQTSWQSRRRFNLTREQRLRPRPQTICEKTLTPCLLHRCIIWAGGATERKSNTSRDLH